MSEFLTAADVEPGDIFACTASDPTSLIIRTFSFSARAPWALSDRPSHVAIALRVEGGLADMLPHRAGEIVWVEQTTLCPHACLVSGVPRAGLQLHTINQRVDDYTGRRPIPLRITSKATGLPVTVPEPFPRRVELYKPTEDWRLSAEEQRQLADFIAGRKQQEKTDPDATAYSTGWAVASGRVARLVFADVPPPEDARFCSQLLARMLQLLPRTRLDAIGPSKLNPTALMRRLARPGRYSLAGRLS
ncbi:MAG: hypothetical protein AAF532_17270 [Planctomycetota bacterium]